MLPIYYCRCRLEAGTLAAHQGLFRHAGPATLFEPSRDASDGHHTFGLTIPLYVESVILAVCEGRHYDLTQRSEQPSPCRPHLSRHRWTQKAASRRSETGCTVKSKSYRWVRGAIVPHPAGTTPIDVYDGLLTRLSMLEVALRALLTTSKPSADVEKAV